MDWATQCLNLPKGLEVQKNPLSYILKIIQCCGGGGGGGSGQWSEIKVSKITLL